MAITNVTLLTTATTVFTSVGESAITTMFFCNSSVSITTDVDIHIVPSAGSAGTGTLIIKGLELSPKETYVFENERLILSNNDRIMALSTATNIVIATVSAVQIS